MTADKEILRTFFDDINRNDIAAAARAFAPDIVRHEPEGFPTSGVHRGADDVKAHLAQGRGTWAEGSCDPEDYLLAGDKIVVLLHARVRMHDREDWIDGRFADGFILKGGKITEWRTFFERSEALAWSGLPSLS